MFKLIMPIPDAAAVHRIIAAKKAIATGRPAEVRAADGPPLPPRRLLFAAFNPEHAGQTGHDPREAALRRLFEEARQAFVQRAQLVESIPLLDGVQWHLVTMFLASNRRYDQLERLGALSREQLERARALADLLSYGLGPRAVINLAKAARAWAFCFSTLQTANDAPPADANDLARVLIPVLRHRLKVGFGWEEKYASRELGRRSPFAAAEDPLAALIADFAHSTAPTGQVNGHDNRKLSFGNYRELLRGQLAQVLGLGGAQR
jgi:hypothetical protein